MKELKNIKVRSNMYNDTKFKIIDTKPLRDTIHYIWFRLLTLAGMVNREGELYLSSNIPYTIETFAIEFNRDPEVIKMALDVLIELEMIEISEQNVYIVKNFVKHQNIKVAENKKENVSKVKPKKDDNTDNIEDNKKENKEEGKKGSNDNNADDNENLKKEEVISKNDECKNIDIKASEFNKETNKSKKKDNIKKGNDKNKRSSINNKNIINNNETYNSKCHDDIEGIPLLVDVDSHKNNNINENIKDESDVIVIDEEVDNIMNYDGIDIDIPEEALGTVIKVFEFSDIT